MFRENCPKVSEYTIELLAQLTATFFSLLKQGCCGGKLSQCYVTSYTFERKKVVYLIKRLGRGLTFSAEQVLSTLPGKLYYISKMKMKYYSLHINYYLLSCPCATMVLTPLHILGFCLSLENPRVLGENFHKFWTFFSADKNDAQFR